jgi:hypothetical protein
MKKLLIIKSLLLLSLYLFGQGKFINPDAKDLIIKNSEDSVMCKIINEDSLNVYILFQKNNNEVKTYVAKKDIRAIEKDLYTSQEFNAKPYSDNMEFIHLGNGLRVVSYVARGCQLVSGLIYIANEKEKFYNGFVTFSGIHITSAFTGSLFSCMGASISDPQGSKYYWRKFGTTIIPVTAVCYGLPIYAIVSKSENMGLLVTAYVLALLGDIIIPGIANNLTEEIHSNYIGSKKVSLHLNPGIDYNNNLVAQLTLRWSF